MRNNEAALKYSSALFKLGKEKETLIEFQKDLAQVLDLIEDNDEFKHTFYHQRILPEDKKTIIKKIFQGQISEYVLNFICLLIDNRREQHIKSVIDNFNTLVNEEEAIIEVEIITAVELPEDLKSQLLNKLNKLLSSKIIIHPVVDPEIMGGMVLKFNDFIIDGSIRQDLDRIEKNIKQLPVRMLGV